jgi:PRC-barrel domain
VTRVLRRRGRIRLAIAGVLLAALWAGTGRGLAATPPGPAKPATAPPAPSEAAPAPPKNLEPLPPGKYTGVLGKVVAGPDGKDLGPIVDVIVNVDGTPRAAVIDFGGFLGVGSRKIAVDWRLLNFAPDRADGQIWLSLDRAEIRAAPEYRPDSLLDEMVGPPWAASSAPGAGK